MARYASDVYCLYEIIDITQLEKSSNSFEWVAQPSNCFVRKTSGANHLENHQHMECLYLHNDFNMMCKTRKQIVYYLINLVVETSLQNTSIGNNLA